MPINIKIILIPGKNYSLLRFCVNWKTGVALEKYFVQKKRWKSFELPIKKRKFTMQVPTATYTTSSENSLICF